MLVTDGSRLSRLTADSIWVSSRRTCSSSSSWPSLTKAGPSSGPVRLDGGPLHADRRRASGNAAEYLALPNVFAVGGTWIAPRADIAAGRWDVIAERARAAAVVRP
jgi:hypothetical protein